MWALVKRFFIFYFWSRQGIELHVLGHECDQLDSISRRMDRDWWCLPGLGITEGETDQFHIERRGELIDDAKHL